jgi:hypothetical protein
MTHEHERIVVCPADCASHSVHTTHIHHRDFPEIWAECGNLVETAEHLAQQLYRAHEGARSAWHRDAIERAIADVRAYRESLDRGESPELAPCDECEPHASASHPSHPAHHDHRSAR